MTREWHQQHILAAKCLNNFPNADTCSYKHTRTYKQMSHKHAYTRSRRHAHIVWQHAYRQRVASCLRSWREQNTTCPLIFPSRAKRDSLSNWSHLLLLSHPTLNGSLSAIFSSIVYLSLLFLPISPFACLISKQQILRNYLKSHQGFFFLSGQESNLNVVPGGDGTWWRLDLGLGGQFCQMFLLLLPDRNSAIRSVSVCVWDRVWGQHFSASVFTLSHSFTSRLTVPLFCFWLAESLGADRLIKGRLKHGQSPTTAKPSFATFCVNSSQYDVLKEHKK